MAGDAATRVIAYADAAGYYRTALRFDPTPARRRATITEKLAYALYRSGAGDDTREWLDRALVEYEALGKREKMAQLLLYIARQCWNDADTVAGLPMAKRSLELLRGTHNAPLQAYAWVMMASYSAVVGDAKGTFEQLDHIRPRSLSRRPDILGRYYDARGVAEAAFGKFDEAEKDFERALRIADRSSDCDLIVRTYSNHAAFLVTVGNATRALECWNTAIAAAQRERLIGRLAYALLGCANVHLLVGNIAESAGLVKQAIASGGQNASIQILTATVGITAGLMLEDEVLVATSADERAIERAFGSTESERIGPVARAFVDYYIDARCPDRAADLLRRAVTALRTADQSWWLLVQAALYGDEHTRNVARDLLTRAARPDDATVARAHLALFDAAAPSASDSTDAARENAFDAAREFANLRWPYHQAQALELAGDFRGALEIYRRIGDRHDAARVETILAPRHRRGRAGTSLTTREDEVVNRVAAGKSNREIASMLGISERTVEHHLESVFNRLGVHSRAQLIALHLGGERAIHH
jgi:DNA-binding CsgD family transcriptional regulator